jgi:MYXO-CTERM domain-containing protein
MVITFAPADVGEVSATIMLDSNDPLQPVVEVLVTGRGVLPDEEGEGDGDTASEETTTAVVTEDVKGGCGCATSGAGAPALLGLGGLLALLRRRREPQA